jgi:hypothetical protein
MSPDFERHGGGSRRHVLCTGAVVLAGGLTAEGAGSGLFRVIGLSRYWGLLGPRNWELIQPFKPVFSTWTQSPSRLVAVNRVPLGAEPRTDAFPEGADLMFTPGRCKKTKSRFCAAEVVWGVTALGGT